jgi:hypothetical protein
MRPMSNPVVEHQLALAAAEMVRLRHVEANSKRVKKVKSAKTFKEMRNAVEAIELSGLIKVMRMPDFPKSPVFR